MKAKNWLNKFFCAEILAEEEAEYLNFKRLVGFYNELQQRIADANTLETLLDLHKRMWNLGFKNDNLAPCEYGMFRTNDIEKMTLDEVYLGNIDGLWTFPATKWEKDKEEVIGVNGFGIPHNEKIYDIVCGQYRNLLLLNLRTIQDQAVEYIIEYEEVNPRNNPFALWKKVS